MAKLFCANLRHRMLARKHTHRLVKLALCFKYLSYKTFKCVVLLKTSLSVFNCVRAHLFTHATICKPVAMLILYFLVLNITYVKLFLHVTVTGILYNLAMQLKPKLIYQGNH